MHPLVPCQVFKVLFPEAAYANDAEIPDQSEQDASTTHSQLNLPQPTRRAVFGIFLALKNCRWILPLYSLMALGYTVCRYPLDLYTPCCPFPPKAGPLYSWLQSSLLNISNCKTDKEVSLSGSVVQSGLLLHSTGTGAVIFMDRSFFFSFHFPSF